MATIPEVPGTGFNLSYRLGELPLGCYTTVLSARSVSWDPTGTGHSEIVVDFEVFWLSDRSPHVGLVSVLSTPLCWPLDWDAAIDG